jgi:hypothetical protein
MTPSPSPPFKSAHVRARIVKLLLIVGAITACLSFAIEALSFAFPLLSEDQEIGDNPAGAVLMIVMLLVAILELLIYVATVVFFLVWLYRAHDNLRAFNPWSRPEYSPGWAVGSFFIPFVNLLVPYRAVREVWQKSGPPDEALMSTPAPPAVFPIWWTFWLLASFAGNISMRLSFNERVPESTATMISMVASVLSIVAAAFAYLVVDAIDERQEATTAMLQLGVINGPPPPPANLTMPEVAVPAP